jgi:hypothetical protein
MTRNRSASFAAVALLTACNNSGSAITSVMRDNRPARLVVPDLTAVVYDDAPHPLSAQVLNAGGEDLGTQVSIAAVPANVVEMVGNSVRCRATGDATVVFSGGGLSSNTVMRCRLIRSLRAPQSIVLTVGESPERLVAAALDESGQTIESVPIDVASSSVEVASVGDHSVRGIRVGSTTLQYSVGSRVLARTRVLVRERVFAGPLILNEGALQTRSFTQGKYHVEVQVQQNGGGGITVTWVGTECPSQPESFGYVADCVVPSTASMTLTNPSGFMGIGGATAHGFTTIYRMPND